MLSQNILGDSMRKKNRQEGKQTVRAQGLDSSNKQMKQRRASVEGGNIC